MATGDKLIQVRDLKKYYNRGAIKALDGVTVDIDRGDVMVVIGPSGSGKSTFLRSLNLLEMPTGGSIIFDGVDITKPKTKNAEGKLVKVDIDQHRQKMGMVFQHFNLFPHMTVLKNITLAPVQLGLKKQDEADQQAKKLLERIGLADKAEEYPNMLSGGQKQRIAIVRALANEVITMVKESSICSTYSMMELMWAAKNVAGTTGISVGPYVLVAAIYFCINFPASKAIEAIERRMRRGDKR